MELLDSIIQVGFIGGILFTTLRTGLGQEPAEKWIYVYAGMAFVALLLAQNWLSAGFLLIFGFLPLHKNMPFVFSAIFLGAVMAVSLFSQGVIQQADLLFVLFILAVMSASLLFSRVSSFVWCLGISSVAIFAGRANFLGALLVALALVGFWYFQQWSIHRSIPICLGNIMGYACRLPSKLIDAQQWCSSTVRMFRVGLSANRLALGLFNILAATVVLLHRAK